MNGDKNVTVLQAFSFLPPFLPAFFKGNAIATEVFEVTAELAGLLERQAGHCEIEQGKGGRTL